MKEKKRGQESIEVCAIFHLRDTRENFLLRFKTALNREAMLVFLWGVRYGGRETDVTESSVWVFLQRREFIAWGTDKSFPGSHLNSASRKSLELLSVLNLKTN